MIEIIFPDSVTMVPVQFHSISEGHDRVSRHDYDVHLNDVILKHNMVLLHRNPKPSGMCPFFFTDLVLLVVDTLFLSMVYNPSYQN